MSNIQDPTAQTGVSLNDLAAKVIPAAMDLPDRITLFRSRPDLFSENPSAATRRTAQWIQTLATDTNGLETRLQELGITPSELPLILGDVRADDLESPSWWSVCEEVLSQPLQEEDGPLPTRTYLTPMGIESEDTLPIPFEHVFCAWIDVATQRLRAQVPTLDTIIGAAVLQKEQRGLLENLSLIARHIFLERFALAKASGYDSNDILAGLLSSTPPRDLYCKIVQDSIADGTAALMEDFPAFARLIATRVECWVRTLAEFAERLDADRAELEQTFSPDSKLGALVGGGRGISDSHNGGRAVVVCKFENGIKIVYKPRSMSIDVAWTSLVAFFNSKIDADAHLVPLQVIDHGLYGWMEFADRKACRDTTELQIFYRRMGSLLGLVHMLQGNDFHLENVVAAGPNPIAIDLETISVGDAVVDLQGQEPDPAAVKVEKSVLRALLLPSVMAMRGRDGVRNLGAVGVEVAGDRGLGKTHRRMSQINTDFQRWIKVDGQDPAMKVSEQSRPVLENGDPVDSEDYREDVAEGYRTAYRSILEHRDEWLAPDGPLAFLDQAWGRILNRATNVYYRLFLETCSSELLKSGLDRWIHGQRFRVGSSETSGRDPKTLQIYDAIVTVEENALTRGDVAYFIARGSDCEYYAPDYCTGEATLIPEAVLLNSATEAARMQLSRMGDDDLALQSKLITSSYLTAQLATEGLHQGVSKPLDAEPEVPEATIDATDDEIQDWVRRNFAMLDALAIREDGKANWIDAEMDVMSETARPAALGSGLYTGRGGLALLYERGYRYFGDREFLRSAEAAVQRELILLGRGDASAVGKHFALEGPSGMGQRAGILAAFWAIGRHEGCGHHRDMVHTILDEITDRTVELDTAFDVIAGSAGLMLLMMGMKREDPSFDHHELLIRLGEHLCRNAVEVDGTGWGMENGKKRSLNGFGHGRAGTGLALLEVGTCLDRPDFRSVGLAALRAEHEMRCDFEGRAGWPDLRSVAIGGVIPTDGPSMNAWCAGGEGIALSRAAALEFSDEAFLTEDLEAAIDAIHHLEPSIPTRGRRRHLCCGTSGRAEMFFSLAAILDRDDLAEAGQSLARRKLPPACAETASTGLSLMQGLPGEIWTQLSSLHTDETHLLLLRM